MSSSGRGGGAFGVLVLALLLLVEQCAADQLLLVHAIWRHGDRTPLASFPRDPHKPHWDSTGYGILTPTGQNQHIELGRWLRYRYVTQYRFLPSGFDSTLITAQSSNFQRTIQSAKYNFRGMYNRLPTLRIPNLSTDREVLPLSSCRRSQQFSEMIKRHSAWKTYESNNKAYFDSLTRRSGTSQTFARISVLTDTVRVERSKGMSICCGLNDLWGALNSLEANAMLFNYGYKIGDYGGQNFRVEVPRSLGGPMLNTIIARMRQKVSSSPQKLRYYAYSAHDSTIMNVLSTFGFGRYDYNRNYIPSYAACLLIELWRRTDGTPYVRIVYRRDRDHIYDLSTQISGCRNLGRPCTFNEFVSRSSPYLTGNFDSFCATPPRGY